MNKLTTSQRSTLLRSYMDSAGTTLGWASDSSTRAIWPWEKPLPHERASLGKV